MYRATCVLLIIYILASADSRANPCEASFPPRLLELRMLIGGVVYDELCS
jgi:hypothetical protein